MSKKVLATRNSIAVEGHWVVPGSDGQLYSASLSKGDVLVDGAEGIGHDVVLTKKGIGVVQKVAAIMKEIECLKNSLSKLSTSGCTDYDGLSFEDDNGEPCVKVGCTAVYPDELQKALKTLGL